MSISLTFTNPLEDYNVLYIYIYIYIRTSHLEAEVVEREISLVLDLRVYDVAIPHHDLVNLTVCGGKENNTKKITLFQVVGAKKHSLLSRSVCVRVRIWVTLGCLLGTVGVRRWGWGVGVVTRVGAGGGGLGGGGVM